MLNLYKRYYWLGMAIIAVVVTAWAGVPPVPAIIFGIVLVTGIYFYTLFKYSTELKVLRSYVYALRAKNFSEALTYGRRYYSFKRKGATGLDGSGLTIYDEQAIANDLKAYSLA